ncbi:MAG: nucleotidyltransferase family protein [Terriglobales bacterium]
MPSDNSRTAQNVDILSRLVFRGQHDDHGPCPENAANLYPLLQRVSDLSAVELADFLCLADAHHVTVRALEALQSSASALPGHGRIRSWCDSTLAHEGARIAHAVESLVPICAALEAAGAQVAVIKSLDHWPDLGSDLDLYTDGDESTVLRVMAQQFDAVQETRSWGDRLANKWNFKLPDLPELIEIHVRYLGQTGEQKALARRVLKRSVTRTVDGHSFRVPAPEERVLISTLQRMYRHLYFRLCDMTDFTALLDDRAIDFSELRRAADLGGIWPGVATFLLLIVEYVNSYGGQLEIPREVLAAVPSPRLRVHLGGRFLRVSKGPAAGLFGSQLLNAGRHADFRALYRLPLLPPLAISAFLAYRFTGNDKGVW